MTATHDVKGGCAQGRHRLFVPVVVGTALAATCSWSADEAVRIFADAQDAVFSIQMQVTDEQFELETAAFLEEYREAFFKKSVELDRETMPLTDQAEKLKEGEVFAKEWRERRKALLAQKRQPRHLGMGINIDPQGRVLTCNSIIARVSFPGELSVADAEGNRYPAESREEIKFTNLLVLSIPKEAAETAILVVAGNDRPPIGSDVFSVQRPHSLRPSPFRGMIGSYDCMLGHVAIERYAQLQMDMFPGNSGAPIFTSDGALFGVLADQYIVGSAPALTFAIPREVLTDVVPDLLRYKERQRGYLGIDVKGLEVTRVVPDSPAENCGIEVGDVIVGFNRNSLETPYDLLFYTARSKPNDEIRLLLNRAGQFIELDVVLDPGSGTGERAAPGRGTNLAEPSEGPNVRFEGPRAAPNDRGPGNPQAIPTIEIASATTDDS